jgi:hypothetical protein
MVPLAKKTAVALASPYYPLDKLAILFLSIRFIDVPYRTSDRAAD